VAFTANQIAGDDKQNSTNNIHKSINPKNCTNRNQYLQPTKQTAEPSMTLDQQTATEPTCALSQ